MKKYTAKFLPVEGQVKEGDTYLSKWRKEHKFFHYSTCAKIENGKVFPTEGVGSKDGLDVSDIITKVKLFLCTNEFEAGEEVWQPFNSYSESKKVQSVFNKDFIYFTDKPALGADRKDCFKVIGEISAEAIFVTNDDTFEENQWQLCIKNPDHIWLSVDKQADWSNWIKIIRIKCDKCETFH